MRIGDVFTAADNRQRLRARRVSQETMRAHPGNRAQRSHRAFEARPIGRAQADSEKAHLGDRAGREGFGPAEPSIRSDVLDVRFQSTRYQEVDIEQVAQGSSSSSVFTLPVVIGGATSAATRTGRPNFPRLSLATRRDWRRRSSPRASTSRPCPPAAGSGPFAAAPGS